MSLPTWSLPSSGDVSGSFPFALLDTLPSLFHPVQCSRLYQYILVTFGFQKSLNSEGHQQEMKEYKENQVMVFISRAQLFWIATGWLHLSTKGPVATFIFRDKVGTLITVSH